MIEIEKPFIFHVGTRKFRAWYWETNKGPALGYCKWELAEWVPEIDWWHRHDYCDYPVHPCDVRKQLAWAIRDARQGKYQKVE